MDADQLWAGDQYSADHCRQRTAHGAARRYPIFVWAGAGLLGWIAGEIIITDAAVAGWLGSEIVHKYELWAAAAGAAFVVGLGYLFVLRRPALVGGE